MKPVAFERIRRPYSRSCDTVQGIFGGSRTMHVRILLPCAVALLQFAAPLHLDAKEPAGGVTPTAAKTASGRDAGAKDAAKDEFRAVRRDIQARLRNKQPFERIAAVRDLHHYPTVEAAKLLVAVGLKDDTPEVRSAAYDTLLDFKDDAEIARHLLVTLNKETRRGATNPTTLPMLAVLMASSLPDIERDVSAYLDRQAGTRDGLALIEMLADELGEHAQAEDVPSLTRLTTISAFAREFGLRRAVAQALIRINAPEAIGQLIALLETIRGEIRGEIVQHLTTATGQDLGLEAGPWREWWKENEKTFQTTGAVASADAKNPAPAAGVGRSMYYGLSIYAQKLVFIIDTSGSMLEPTTNFQGTRLAAAKRELLQAIDRLPEDTQFSIVAFNSMVYPWQKQLVAANNTMKNSATRWVNNLEPGNSTASYDALEAGLHFDAEALFFLTDGAPHGGKVQNPVEIVTLITRANYARRLSIYTLGIGVGPAGGVFDEFLSTLAKQNWGVYRRVDQ